VFTSESGEQAMEILAEEKRKLDCVICDLSLRDLPGYLLYQKIVKEAPELARKFIFITGGILSEKTGEFLDRAGLPVIEKPFRMETLTNTINKLAGAH